MVNYFSLGADKQLNEIVFAGSHDAGITEGKSNAMTQDLDIKNQAMAGVRLFDLRIAAEGRGNVHGLGPEAELKAYHGKVSKGTDTRYVTDLGGQKSVNSGKMSLGTFGMGLRTMLQDSVDFVTSQPSEFLILKFDKCKNWPLIAEACVAVLGNRIYTGSGNLNLRTLRELAGKVIVLFTSEGLQAVRQTHPVSTGILGIRNLYAKDGSPAYFPNFDGLQYFGKGGTSLTNFFGNKIEENRKKQTKLMRKGSEGNPEVMGMMYWTSTGLAESIRKRNDKMWSTSNVSALKRMWKQGLSESIESRIAHHVDPMQHAYGNVLKAFMPNVVMIDFADAGKCRLIFELNYAAATSLTDAARALDQEIQQLRAHVATLPQGRRA